MKTRIYALGLFLLIAGVNTSADARKPAVDPVQEISIEEYNDVPPEKARPFDFSQDSKKSATKKILVKKQVPIKSIKSLEDKNHSFNYLFLFIFFLPFAIWIGIKSTLKSKEENIEDNVTELKTKKDSDDDMNFPKAS